MSEPHAHPYVTLDEADDDRDTVTAGAVDDYPARKLLDEMNDAELTALYDELDTLRARASRLATNWGYAFGLLSQASDWLPAGSLRDRIDAALDEPKEK